ncbi:hypothetical protein NDU88_010432 [Pleurodeles waltl]|uniref:Uncharacterized protein n=1 Tax=Pleurodeles waltl TaxID=8319 RepID=A0AAV7PUW7_PLEWA|nr:hypothetical protein NDU88_010432 [Pleurodeles waltl]
MDRIRARVDEHDARFEQLESCTSAMEDQRHGETEHLLQMERVLEVIRNKNEDLEARSRRNNVRMLPGSMVMGRMEDFMEKMLVAFWWSRGLIDRWALGALLGPRRDLLFSVS